MAASLLLNIQGLVSKNVNKLQSDLLLNLFKENDNGCVFGAKTANATASPAPTAYADHMTWDGL